VTGPQETVLALATRGEYSNSKEITFSDLGVEYLRPFNPPITNLSVPILVQVFPSRVTPYKCQIVLQEAMEENVATSLQSPHTPSIATTIGGVHLLTHLHWSRPQ
jgi:hypothetical protein